MAKKLESKTEEQLQNNVGKVIGSSEVFIEKNQKKILIGVGIVVLILLGIMAFQNLYVTPREVAAENAMYKAQEFFAIDSFKIALEGNGSDVMGFKEIVSEYGVTKSGNLASAYTGICYYKLGKYQDAIKYLSQYDGKDNFFKTSVIGLIGDCYAETNESSKAQSYYKKAIADKNELAAVYLKKSGILYEIDGDAVSAEKMYQQIKDEYPESSEAADIDKYIARVQK